MKKLLILLSVFLLCGSAFASSKKHVEKDVAVTQEKVIDESVFLKKINKEYPNLNVVKSVFIPSVKLYEIHLKGSNNLAYTNGNIDYFIINGQIINPKTKQSITLERDLEFVKSFVAGLPYEKSIVEKFGTGERKIVVFTDPDCPFCKETDKLINSQMTKDNITINYFMNPLRIKGHEDAPLKARKIWCSNDRSAAWKDWMLNGNIPANDGTCKNPVSETKEIAEENGFNSTPTIIFDNGFVWKGAITPAQIREILNKK